MKAHPTTRPLAALVVLCLLFQASAALASDVFLSLGATIPGDTTRKGFEKQLPVVSYSFAVTFPTNTGSTRETVKLRPLIISRAVDRASPLIMQAVGTGVALSRVVLTVVTATEQSPNAAPLVIELTNAVVRDYQATGSSSADGVGTEQFTLEYATIKMSVAGVDGSGKATPAVDGSIPK